MIEKSNLHFSLKMKRLLESSGAIEQDTVTIFGERMFNRGPGPYGIIHAYHGYMAHHVSLLKGKKENFWVARGENVAASQDANFKSFKQINDSLDQFCSEYNFSYSVFIEHAVGQGEASRQRYLKSGEEKILYFGV